LFWFRAVTGLIFGTKKVAGKWDIRRRVKDMLLMLAVAIIGLDI
jgi:hypothetical protein